MARDLNLNDEQVIAAKKILKKYRGNYQWVEGKQDEKRSEGIETSTKQSGSISCKNDGVISEAEYTDD